MNRDDDGDAAALGQTLRRLEELTGTLDGVGNEPARDAARELLRLVLDLHGLAVARIMAIVAAAADGRALTAALAEDPYARAALLLHGLHPQEPRERLAAAIERLSPAWRDRGFAVELVGIGRGSARILIRNRGGGEPAYVLQQEIEDALADAAPDLDELIFEVDGSAQQAA